MEVDAPAISLAYFSTSKPTNASAAASISYLLPYTDDADQSVAAHLREAGFERVERPPYPELTTRKTFPSWEANDFYQRGEVYAHLSRDTEFKHFMMSIGSAMTLKLLSRDMDACD